MRTIKRIIKIHEINGFLITCLFNTGESRIIDFQQFFDKWNLKPENPEFTIQHSESAFQKVALKEGTLSWPDVKIKYKNATGQPAEYPLEMDPIVLYENSEPDETRPPEIGLLIKQARTEMGLTQEQLAKKSGTTKHHISRIENNKTGIELNTLMRIVEGGLGRRMKISIQ